MSNLFIYWFNPQTFIYVFNIRYVIKMLKIFGVKYCNNHSFKCIYIYLCFSINTIAHNYNLNI